MEQTKKVTRDEVKRIFEETKNPFIGQLLKELEEFDTGLCSFHRVEAELAKKFATCELCEKVLTDGDTFYNRDNLQISGSFNRYSKIDVKTPICRDCRDKCISAEAEKKSNKQWTDLFNELTQKRTGYVTTKDHNDMITGIEFVDGTFKGRIFRDTIFGHGAWHSSGAALRISTNDFDIKANKLRKDFGDTGLAGSLDKSMTNLLEKWNAKLEAKAAKNSKTQTMREKILAAFPEAANLVEIEERDHGYRSFPKYYKTGQWSFHYKGTTMSTWDGETFTFVRSYKGNAEQVKALLNN